MPIHHTLHHRSDGIGVSIARWLHLQLVGPQQLLAGGGAGGHRDRRAPGDDDRRAGQDVRGHQAHAVGHGCQVRRVAQAGAGAQALADGEGLLWVGKENNNFSREKRNRKKGKRKGN